MAAGGPARPLDLGLNPVGWNREEHRAKNQDGGGGGRRRRTRRRRKETFGRNVEVTKRTTLMVSLLFVGIGIEH